MKVSVCIPSYNHPELFKRCLSSVLMQDMKDYEIIVSDDSSNDQIKNYVQELNNPLIKYYHNPQALGSPENWNNAVKKASGKYIKILHHDDYLSDETVLRKFVSVLNNNPSVSFVFCYTKIIFKADNTVFIHRQTNGQIKRLTNDIDFLFYRNVIGAPSAVCYRRDDAILFNRNYKWLVDVEFYLHYMKTHRNFFCIAEPLVTVVAGEEGQISKDITQDKKRIISENLNLFSAIFSDKLNHKKSLLYFQELFTGYNVLSYENLKKEVEIPANLIDFCHDVFIDLPKATLLKKIKKRLLTSRYNKQIFKIERF